MLVDWYVADVHIPFIIRDGKADLFPSQISSFTCATRRIRPQYSLGHAPVHTISGERQILLHMS
jgi:hypothetical protein